MQRAREDLSCGRGCFLPVCQSVKMTEPIGALVGSWFLLSMGGSTYIIGMSLGLAAGVMTYITVDEIIPVAHELSTASSKHYISTGLLAGMILGLLLSVVLNV